MVIKTTQERFVGVASALLVAAFLFAACGSESRDFAQNPGLGGTSPGAAGGEPGPVDPSGGAAGSPAEPTPNLGGSGGVGHDAGAGAPGEGGAGGRADGPRLVGEGCAESTECATGECVDDVCCESACDGVCEACVEASTGEPDGTCAPMGSGPDPDADLESNPNHCGECQNECQGSSLPGTSPVCSAGQCSVACPSGTLGDGTNACIPTTTVTAGSGFSCGLLEDGHVKCWGDPDLDLNPAGLVNVLFRSITAATSFVCGIRDNGLALCWGNNPPIPGSGVFHALAAGTAHVCGIRANGTLSCWGNTDGLVVTPPSGTYKFVASGADYSCALVRGGPLDGRATCWGDGMDVASDFPTTSSATTFTQIYGGDITGWGIRPNGTADSWGLVRFPPPPGTVFKTVGAGGFASRCGILSDRSVACWGAPGSAVAIAPSGSFSAIAMGGSHACAVKVNGSIQCWGTNDVGQAPAEVTGPFQGYW